MAILKITTPFNIDLEFKIAEFHKRIAAWLIDIMCITVYYYLMLRFIYPNVNSGDTRTATELFLVIIPVLVYQLVFELFRNGQTIGKMVAGIKVIDIEGREPTWGQYISRWLLCIGNLYVYVVPYYIQQMIFGGFGQAFMVVIVLLVLYLPDFLSVAISANSQRIGDFAAGTVVIDKNYRSSISETIYLQIEEENYQPVFPQVMRLTDRDINGIRNLLHVKTPSRDSLHYITDVARKIKKVLDVETDMPPTDFLRQLLQDYNYFTTK